METYGAKRLYDCFGSRYDIMVPRYKVGRVSFMHSGSYYIVPKDGDVPKVIMNQAMAELTNETYKKLLSCPEIQNIPKFLSPKMQELRKLLVQYDNMVNPFANSNLKLKEPIEYLDKIKFLSQWKKNWDA